MTPTMSRTLKFASIAARDLYIACRFRQSMTFLNIGIAPCATCLKTQCKHEAKPAPPENPIPAGAKAWNVLP